jgi:acyl carrier protein
MPTLDVRTTIKTYIADRMMIGRRDELLADSDSLLDKGIIDSTGVLELVGYIEESFGVSVDDDELTPENLGSVDNIVAYIVRKVGMHA